jgi:osmotically-inducible protein OsmY
MSNACTGGNEEVRLAGETQRSSKPRSIVEIAKSRLRDCPHLTTQRVWCELQDRRLFLRGQVPSFYLKQLAQTAVVGLEGVDQVVNEIEVIW